MVLKDLLEKHRVKLVLSLILLFALVMRLVFFVGLNWDDDPGYAGQAYEISKGHFFFPTHHFYMRIMITWPLALCFFLFGFNDFSLTIYPLICSLATILLIFYLGKRLFSEKVGLLAAFLLSFYPLDVINSTWMLPTVPLSFFSTLAIFLFLKGEGLSKDRSSPPYLLYLISGGIVGICPLLVERGFIILLFFMAYFVYEFISSPKMLTKKQTYIKYLSLLVGFLIIFGTETFYYWFKSGEIFYKYKILMNFYTVKDAVTRHSMNINPHFYPQAFFNLNSSYRFDWHNKYNVNYGLFFYFVVPAIIYTMFKRNRHGMVLIIWLMAFFLWMQFGSMSFTRYIPMHRLYRHVSILITPSLLLVAYFIACSQRKITKVFSSTGVFFLLITSIYYTYYLHFYNKLSVADTRSIYEFLKTKPPKVVYADGGTIGHLRYYFKFQRDQYLRIIDSISDCDSIRDSYIITYSTRGWIEYAPFYNNIPLCIRFTPPSHWELVKEITAANMEVYQRFNPKIYYVSPYPPPPSPPQPKTPSFLEPLLKNRPKEGDRPFERLLEQLKEKSKQRKE